MEPTAPGSFNFVAEPVRHGQRYRLLHQGEPVAYERAVHGLCEEREVRELLAECLRTAPYDAFFWETPPVTAENRDRGFEFVLVDSPVSLASQHSQRLLLVSSSAPRPHAWCSPT